MYYTIYFYHSDWEKKKKEKILHYLFMLIEEESAGESLFVKL